MQNILLLVLFLQIALESLPVSSSGHLCLLGKVFFLGVSPSVLDVLDFFAHGATLFIVVLFFRRYWCSIFSKLFACSWQRESYKRLFVIFLKIVGFVFLADVLTALFYLFIRVWGKDVVFLQSSFFLLGGFCITAISLLSLKKIKRRTYASLNLYKVIVLGCVQGVALLPGISRFAVTYVAASWMGLSPRRSFQVSFLIQVPLIAAAFVQSLTKLDVLPLLFVPKAWLLIGFAMVLGYGGLWIAQKMAYINRFYWFGYYMIFPILLTLFFIMS